MYNGSASRATMKATTVKLYNYAMSSFLREIIEANQIETFLQEKEYLKELCQSDRELRTLFTFEAHDKKKRHNFQENRANSERKR